MRLGIKNDALYTFSLEANDIKLRSDGFRVSGYDAANISIYYCLVALSLNHMFKKFLQVDSSYVFRRTESSIISSSRSFEGHMEKYSMNKSEPDIKGFLRSLKPNRSVDKHYVWLNVILRSNRGNFIKESRK